MSDQITYDNKVDLQVATNIANINKVTASDMNEIKDVVNSHADDIDELNAPEKWVSVGTTAPTDGTRVWFENSVNMFDVSTLVGKTYNNTISTTRACNSQAIYLEPGTYTFTTNIDTSTYEFKSDVLKEPPTTPIAETYIHNSGFGSNQTRNITISTGGYFAILIRNKSNTDLNITTLKSFQYQLQKGSTASTYEPYVEKTINIDNEKFIGQEELVSVGKGQPGDGKRVWFAKSKNLFDKNSDIVNNYTFGGTGDLVSASDFFYQSKFIPVKPNTTYSCSGSRVVGSDSLRVTEYTASQTFIKRNYELYTITTSSTTYFIRVSNYKTLLDTLQVEEGSTATSYEPYIEPSINVDGEKMYYDNYSTSEKVIGKWIDGRNLYRKVINITSINTNANATDVSISLSNLNEIVNIGGSVRTNSGQYKPVTSVYVDGNGVQTRYIFSVYTVYSTTLTVSYGDWWKNVFGKANIIIEYTKTTD